MPLSNSVIRRYTPPTCTLEIMATNSPLSRWMGQPVLKQLQYEIRFDDPRLPDEQRVKIHGDRSSLEALHEAVTTYVQDLLKQSPDRFNAILPALASRSSDGVVSSSSQELDLSAREEIAPKEQFAPQESAIATSEKIFLQPGAGLSHDLFLGPLANQETGPVINLSVLQLFDLATALDEFAADVVALPTLSSPRAASAPRAWASIAAIVLVAAGLMTAVVELLNRSDPQQRTANRSQSQKSSSDEQQIALQPSLLPTVSTTPPGQLSAPETLPSLPPTSSIVPLPSSSIPPSVATLPRTAPPSPGASQLIVPGKSLALPTIPGAVTTPSENAARTSKQNPKGTPSFAITPQTPPVNFISPVTQAPPISISPDTRQNKSKVLLPGESAVPGTSSGLTPSVPVAPLGAATPSPSSQLTPANPDLLAALSRTNRGTAPGSESSDTPTTQQSPDSATLRERLRATRNQPRSNRTTSNEATTAFDSIPQVAEARDYFKKRWEPPSGLTQSLEYSLLLDVDGTIQRIEPLGPAARNYVDRTGMPLIGESFVSRNRSGQTPRIRLVLAPDGTVQTFLESSN